MSLTRRGSGLIAQINDRRLNKVNKIRLTTPALFLFQPQRLSLLVLTGLCLVVVCELYFSWSNAGNAALPNARQVPAAKRPRTFTVAIAPATQMRCDWAVFRNLGGSADPADTGASESQILQRLRLAGTFCLGDGQGEGEIRKAVLDDLKNQSQHIVGENDFIDDLRVEKILPDKVTICHADERIELRLMCGQIAAAGTNTENTTDISNATNNADQAFTEGQIIQTNKFGSQIGQTRWVFNRRPIMDYYQLMMDNPERMAKVFDTLKPLYDANRKITGYKVGIEGESEFFKDVGLQQNDIVRAVNSLPMTNRRRAVFFINEFVNERANVFVLEVERDGKVEKFIYQVQ